MLVVGVGRTEAKVEGLFSEVCRLDYKGNALDAMGGEVLKGAPSPCHVLSLPPWQADWCCSGLNLRRQRIFPLL